MDRYISFDVETPNRMGCRMSAIGITVIEGGRITEEYYSLVDPEQEFDGFNVMLTGIGPEQVRGKPAFPQLWEKIEPYMSSGLLIAHNAPFDMGVLAKCLRDYDIEWRETVRYACTCQMGRRLMPELPNHRLDTMCDYLGLALCHHDAGSDSRACAGLLLHYLELEKDISPYTRDYDLKRIKTISRKKAAVG